MDIVRALFVTLAAFTAAFVLRLGLAFYRSRSLPAAADERAAAPAPIHTVIGFVTNFFDTLGIGSFATTTTLYKLLKLVPDERIPGTMLAGHTLPMRILVESHYRRTTTEVLYRDLRVNPEIDDRLFSIRTLEQKRKIPGAGAKAGK